jgi:hypothetical protein
MHINASTPATTRGELDDADLRVLVVTSTPIPLAVQSCGRVHRDWKREIVFTHVSTPAWLSAFQIDTILQRREGGRETHGQFNKKEARSLRIKLRDR